MFSWFKKLFSSPNTTASGVAGFGQPAEPSPDSSGGRFWTARSYEDPESADYAPDLADADRAIGSMAAELVRDKEFPSFTELVHTGDGCEPRLIFRDGDSFLIVETDVIDCSEDEADVGTWRRELPDGKIAARGSPQYLWAGIEDLARRPTTKALAAAIQAARSANRVRYILVTAHIDGTSEKQEVDSLEFAEYNL